MVSNHATLSTGTPTFDLVISYRRDDTQATSNAIYRELVRRFGADRVLLDITSVPVGEDYDQFVRRIIAKSKAVIVVIGPEWLEIKKQGLRRLDRDDDPVRGEVLAAMAAQVPLIPLLVDGATAPEASALPASMANLARLNMMPILERYWDTDMETLAKRLTPLLGAAAEPPDTKSAPKIWRIAIIALMILGAGAAAIVYFTVSPVVPTEVGKETEVPLSNVSGIEPKSRAASPGKQAPEAATDEVPAVTRVKVPVQRRPLVITMIHETGRPRAYAGVYVSGDDIHFGQALVSLKTGSLYDLLKQYASAPDARFAPQLQEYLGRVEAKDPQLASDDRFKDLLARAAGEDRVMVGLQDALIDDRFFGLARKESEAIGVKSLLGQAMIADMIFHMGHARFLRVKQTTIKQLDGTPMTGVDEHEWLRRFAAQRIEASAKLAMAKSIRQRVETYTKLMALEKWDLSAPVPVGGFELVDP